MPLPGKRWRHIILNTRNTWLPGDVRGFRSRKHRVHSSGDYKHPPSPEEHTGLRTYFQTQSGDAVHIHEPLRSKIGAAILQRMQKLEHRVLVIAVSSNHVHVLVELPDDVAKIKTIIGRAKQIASRAVHTEMPGEIWAGGCSYKAVDDVDHQRKVFEYIQRHINEGAWIRSYREKKDHK